MVRRDGLGGSKAASASPWGPSATSSDAVSEVEGGDEEQVGKGKKKGNKGKKQVIMNWG